MTRLIVVSGFLVAFVAGVLIGVLTFHSGGRTMRPRLGDEIAALLVRGVLADPARLPEIRSASSEWLRENVR